MNNKKSNKKKTKNIGKGYININSLIRSKSMKLDEIITLLEEVRKYNKIFSVDVDKDYHKLVHFYQKLLKTSDNTSS